MSIFKWIMGTTVEERTDHFSEDSEIKETWDNDNSTDNKKNSKTTQGDVVQP